VYSPNASAVVENQSTSNQFDMYVWTARQSTPPLPKFTGSLEDWPMFLSTLETSTKRCQFDYVDNMYRLEQALKGEAREIVKSMLHNPENVPLIVETLMTHYDRPELLMKKQIEKVRRFPNVDERKLETVVSFSIAIKNLCATMETNQLSYYYNDGTLLDMILEKLPIPMKLRWIRHYKQHHAGASDKLLLFRDWIAKAAEDAYEILPEMHLMSISDEKEDSSKNVIKRNTRVNVHITKEKSADSCIVCGSECKHEVEDCCKFLSSSPSERWDIVREKRLCRQCLRRHPLRPPFICEFAVKCTVTGCTRKHHPLVHNDELNKEKNETPCVEQNKEDQPSGIGNYTQRNIVDDSLYRYVPVVLSNGKNKMKVVAFLDEGSGGTFIEENVAKELGLSGPSSTLCLLFTGESHRSEPNSQKVSVTIAGQHDGAKQFVLNNTIHKQGEDRKKLRPINSNIDFPTQNVSKWLVQE